MVDEIQINYESGNNLYAMVRNTSGQVWCASVQTFEDYGAGGHDADDYDVPLTDKDGDLYIGSFDGNIPAGRYTVGVFLQSGDNPADGDKLIGSGILVWSGTAELTTDKILANKAVQNKLTGQIEYYDDDGQTVILTHSPVDSESTITRNVN
jgi:hypothetical protein